VDCLQVASDRGNAAHDSGMEVNSASVKAYGCDNEAARGKVELFKGAAYERKT